MSSTPGNEDTNDVIMITKKKKKSNEGKEKRQQRVALSKLFAFADFYDYVLMGLGSVGACVHGASMPVFFVFFGKLINSIGISADAPQEASHRVAKVKESFLVMGMQLLAGFCISRCSYAVFIMDCKCGYAEVACWMHSGERQAAKMRMAYLKSTLNQEISLFDTEASTGEVIAAITSDIITVQDAISEKLRNGVTFSSLSLRDHSSCKDLGFPLRELGGRHAWDGNLGIWQISLVTVSILPLIVLAGGLNAYLLIGLTAKVRKSYAMAGQIAEGVIGNVRTVQAFVGEKRAIRSYREALRNTYEYGRKAGLAKGLGIGIVHCVLFLSWALLVWFCSIIVHKNIASGADSFTTMLNVVISGLSLGMAVPDISAFVRAKVAAYPIFEMIERNKRSTKTDRKLDKWQGHIEFREVCFSYPSRPDVMIFDKFFLDIPSGKIVALVGGSGSGKSTVISLIERFYEPLSGQILLDGNDIKDFDLKWLRQQIGLVGQEPALFATSIKENILYGKGDATLAEITHAAKLSAALSFINNLPDGFETQKQRIAISRAMVKNPSILLLDEATSALDAESERSVQEALDHAMVGRTTVVVAHRLSTVRNADMIAVVQEGKIVEIGSHEELISDPSSVYASLVHLQDAASSQRQPSLSLTPTSSRYSRELSQTRTSYGASFNSDKGSDGHAGIDTLNPTRQRSVSMKRLYLMIGPDWIYGVIGTICAFITGAVMPLFSLGLSQALVAFYMDWDTTRQEIKKIVILYCCGAVITVVVYGIEHLCFGIMGERLTLRVREMMFSAILRNEIGWFDDLNNASSVLASRLESDATLLRTIVVDRSTILLNNTLFLKGYGGNLSKAYLKANMLAGEAVSNIRTVAAFSAEEKVLDLYARELVEPSKRSFTRGQIAGIFYGICQFFIFSSYGLALWYMASAPSYIPFSVTMQSR
ncbi:unnamed protein product [Dovyalis caffra]|uniref:Uncharacterized protein n=1 Tax=Dovyalis caffra TaxID=77055 RepID=A0AAV1STP5_9ROSI|nr:unnamed protein product [Dovyalis caffra]